MQHTTDSPNLLSNSTVNYPYLGPAVCTPSSATTDRDTMQRWKEQVSKKGMMLSKQRLLIMDAIFNQPVFEDIEGIWLALRNDHQISWAAFYSFIRVAIKEKWIIQHGEKINQARFELSIH